MQREALHHDPFAGDYLSYHKELLVQEQKM